MFGWGPATKIYLAAGATDMRKGFDGLYALVRDRLELEPLSGHVFLFSNAQRNRMKLIYWDGSGFGYARNGSREGVSVGRGRRQGRRRSCSATKKWRCWWAGST